MDSHHQLRNVIPFPASRNTPPAPEVIAFHRQELAIILSIYGRMVAAGQWRDYAIGTSKEYASFAIYRRTSERPSYVIEKCPKNRHRQGMYALFGQDGRALKRGHDLKQVLSALNRKLMRLADTD